MFPMHVFLEARDHGDLAADMLASLDHQGHLTAGQLSRHIGFVCASVGRRPELAEPLRDAIERLLHQLDEGPAEGTIAAHEAALLRTCKRVVTRLARDSDGLAGTVPAREILWLTHRLYQWVTVQLSGMHEDDRRQALADLSEAATSRIPGALEETGHADVLDPDLYGPDAVDQRRLAVLNLLELVLDARLPPKESESSVFDGLDATSLLSASAREVVEKWAQQPLTRRERDLRTLGESVSTLAWTGSATVPDAALAVFLREDPARFAELGEEGRMRWIQQIPDRPGDASAPPKHILYLILYGCAMCAASLTRVERVLLRKRLEGSFLLDDGDHLGKPVWITLLALYQNGERDLDGLLHDHLNHAMGVPIGPELAALYWDAMVRSRVAPDVIEQRVTALFDAVAARGGEAVPLALELLRFCRAAIEEGGADDPPDGAAFESARRALVDLLIARGIDRDEQVAKRIASLAAVLDPPR